MEILFPLGLHPFDIDQNECNVYVNYGWYFSYWGSTLLSGPPHNYKRKEYGEIKKQTFLTLKNVTTSAGFEPTPQNEK